MARIMKIFLLMLGLLLPAFAGAGSSEASKPVLPLEEVAKFTDGLERDLAARGAQVAIVARVGRDRAQLPDGIDYTHVAYWVYSKIERADGTSYFGYQAYNLYQTADDLTRSTLVQDSPVDFFAGAYALDAGIVIPDPRVQRKLLNVIASPTYSALHNSRYSVLANPRTRDFQNCTEHTLDVLMASLYDTDNLAQIKANITAHFDAQPIRIGGFKRLLAPAASAALTTSDHGATIKTATFGSIARFMSEHDLSVQIYQYTPGGAKGFGV